MTNTRSGGSEATLDRSILVAPGDERWDVARATFNLTIDQQPEMIALPRSEQDVEAAVGFARNVGLQVAPQCSSHGAFALGTLGDTLLLRTDLMRGVEIDPDARVARVSAGARWEDVVSLAEGVGLVALHGTSADVGVVGYTLGGGLSWYARKYGLACNRVTAVELVTADGRLRRVDEDDDADLFWALRGGGGNFGVVTALEFELEPVRQLYAGKFLFAEEFAAPALHAWRDWVNSVPDELTSLARMITMPPVPEVPESLRGRTFAEVEIVFLGDEVDGAELVAPLRALVPELDTVGPASPSELLELHMDPREPLPYRYGHALLTDLTHDAIDDIAQIAGAGSPLLAFEVRHIGGAASRSDEGHGALDRLPGSFCTFGIGLVPDVESLARVTYQLGLADDALAQSYAGSYMNFAEHRLDPGQFFAVEQTLARLRDVKHAVDPRDMFRAAQPVVAAPGD